MLNNVLNTEEEFHVTTACCEEFPPIVNIPEADSTGTESQGKGPFGHF
jgi:hypothetical protein